MSGPGASGEGRRRDALPAVDVGPAVPASPMTPVAWSAFDRAMMARALELAQYAAQVDDEVPVGAVIVRDGRVLAEGWNRNIGQHDPTAHAEIMALRAAAERAHNYRLPGTTLYVTLEPCAMCAMALVHARVARVVYATRDPRTGAAGSVFDILGSDRHNHRIEVRAGLEAEVAGQMLRAYFRAKRRP